VRFGVRLAVLFVIVGLIPLGLVGHFAFQRSRDSLVDATRDHLLSVSVLKEDALRGWMETNRADVEGLGGRADLVGQAAALLDTPPAGPERMRAREELTESVLGPNLASGGIRRLIVMHPQTGEIIASTEPNLIGRFREHEAYFVEGLAGTYVAPVTYAVSEERLTLYISAPIVAADGQVVGVLAGEVDLEEMGRIVSLESGAFESEDTYLVNDSAFFVTEPKFGGTFALTRTVTSLGAERAVAGEQGIGEYENYRGSTVIGAYRWVDDLYMALLVEVDRDEALAPIGGLQSTFILIGIVAGMGVLAASALMARALGRPIRLLARGVAEVGRGNLDHRVVVAGRGETAHLGRVFNEMLDNLQAITASRDDLEREIVRREAAEAKQREHWDRFTAVLESFPDMLYVADPETYEVLFVNRAFADLLGKDPVGAKCYEAIQGLDRPCESCSNDIILETRKPYTWEHRNPLLDRHYLITDQIIRWPDGRDVRFEVAKDVTDLKGLEAETDRLAQYFANVMDNEDIWMNVLDPEGRVVEWNRGAEAISGYSADEIVGHAGIWERVYPSSATRREILEQVRRIRESGATTLQLETEIIRKDGTSRTILWNTRVLTGVGGEFIGTVTIGRDVTERLEALRAVAREKEITDSIIASLPGVFYQIDRSGSFARWNEHLSKASGYSDEEIAAMSPVELFNGEDRATIEQSIAHVFRDGHVEAEARLVAKDGTSRPYLFTGVRKEVDGIPMLIGMGTDIGALRLAEAAVRANEAKYRGLFENAQFGIFRTRLADGTAIDVNERLAEILETTRDELLARPSTDFWVDLGQRADVHERLRRERRLADLEIELQTPDGRRKTVLETMYLTESGQVIEGSVVDITRRKEAEEKLERLLEELQRSNEELEQFAYVASHDLQEPLRMVSSYTQLLEKRYRDALDDDARDFIHYAVDGANRMQRLINDLLSYSRVQTRGHAFEETDLNSVLGIARSNLSGAVAESGAVVTNHELPTVLADEAQMVSVLQNLIGNGIKFRSEEAPRILVTCEDSETEWVISVRDNGIGIEAEFADRVFVIFQRLHGRSEYPGTGIGLALVKRIIERHGGRVWVESKLGEGSVFRFTLPKERKKG